MKNKPAIETTSIPELLIETRGNQSELARRLGINYDTLTKYINDKDCLYHCIVNGVFMNTSRMHRTDYRKHVPTSNPVAEVGTKPGKQEKEEAYKLAKEIARKAGFI